MLGAYIQKLIMLAIPLVGQWIRMPVTKVDEKGRVVLPGEFRRKMGISAGDEFIVEELGPDSLVLKRVNLRALMLDIIEKAKNIDMDKLEIEIEEEANQLARRRYMILD
jgi:AbrB family looped-hinge helix DNA binding protein